MKRIKKLDGKRFGFFGKGGSGKSTVVITLARAFRKLGYDVCIIDADSTNEGLTEALGFKKSPKPLIDYYGGMVFSGGLVTCPVDDPSPLPKSKDKRMLPSTYYVKKDGITLFQIGKMGQAGPGAGCDGPILKIARDFRPEIENGNLVTLLDFKAGI